MEIDSLFFDDLDFFFCEAKRRGIGQTGGEGNAENLIQSYKFSLGRVVKLTALYYQYNFN